VTATYFWTDYVRDGIYYVICVSYIVFVCLRVADTDIFQQGCVRSILRPAGHPVAHSTCPTCSANFFNWCSSNYCTRCCHNYVIRHNYFMFTLLQFSPLIFSHVTTVTPFGRLAVDAQSTRSTRSISSTARSTKSKSILSPMCTRLNS